MSNNIKSFNDQYLKMLNLLIHFLRSNSLNARLQFLIVFAFRSELLNGQRVISLLLIQTFQHVGKTVASGFLVLAAVAQFDFGLINTRKDIDNLFKVLLFGLGVRHASVVEEREKCTISKLVCLCYIRSTHSA